MSPGGGAPFWDLYNAALILQIKQRLFGVFWPGRAQRGHFISALGIPSCPLNGSEAVGPHDGLSFCQDGMCPRKEGPCLVLPRPRRPGAAGVCWEQSGSWRLSGPSWLSLQTQTARCHLQPRCHPVSGPGDEAVGSQSHTHPAKLGSGPGELRGSTEQTVNPEGKSDSEPTRQTRPGPQP